MASSRVKPKKRLPVDPYSYGPRPTEHPMGNGVLDTLGHPAGVTGIATVLGYAVILAIMTAALFGGGWLAFWLFG